MNSLPPADDIPKIAPADGIIKTPVEGDTLVNPPDPVNDRELIRAKVLIILVESRDHPLSIGHAARRILQLIDEITAPLARPMDQAEEHGLDYLRLQVRAENAEAHLRLLLADVRQYVTERDHQQGGCEDDPCILCEALTEAHGPGWRTP